MREVLRSVSANAEFFGIVQAKSSQIRCYKCVDLWDAGEYTASVGFRDVCSRWGRRL